MPSTAQVVTLGLVVLAVAFLFPTLINAADSGRTDATVTVGNGSGDVVNAENALRIQKMSQSGDSVTLTVTAIKTGNMTEFSITEGENTTFVLDGHTIDFEAIVVDSNTGETVHRVTYPVTMGWTDNSEQLSDELPLVFAALPVIVIIGLAVKVIG